MLTSMRRWLLQSVIEDVGIDRPFKLRRLSALLMAGGWLLFLASCLIGCWLGSHNRPVIGWFDLLRGGADRLDAWQATKVALEGVGGAAFFAGMFSVAAFDRRDRVPVWRAE